MRAGVAIVGGGIMGAWAVLEASRGADPLAGPAVLFDGDASDGPELPDCGLASEAFVAPELVGLARRGMREVAGFETNTGRAVEFGRPGAVVLGAERAEHVQNSLLERRIEGVDALDGSDLAGKFYGLALDEGEGGLWLPHVAHLDVEMYYTELLGLARTRGAITRFGTSVSGVRVELGKVVGLETSRGFCETKRVVVTAPQYVGLTEMDLGLVSKSVERWRFRAPLVVEEAGCGMESLGAGGVGELLSDPAKVESFFAPGEGPVYAHPALVDLGRRFRVWCDPQNGTLVATGCSDDGRLGGGGRFSSSALELVLERLPFHGDSLEMALEVEHVELMERESGSPVVSAVPGVEGLFVALGLGERGVELAPGLAEGLCQMIEGQPVAAFDPAVMDLGAL